MTLIITAATRDLMVQSADVRMSYPSGFIDSAAQKVFLLSNLCWHGTVAYCGIAHTGRLDVSLWLAEKVGANQASGSNPTQFIEELTSASAWLNSLPSRQDKRHTFVVAGFSGIQPFISMVSNFETLNSPDARPSAAMDMVVSTVHPTKPLVIARGSGAPLLARQDRRRVQRAFDGSQSGSRVAAALAELNRRTAGSMAQTAPLVTVSEACQTAWVNSIGQGATTSFDLPDDRNSAPELERLRALGLRIPSRQRPDGTYERVQVRQMATARVDNTREFHEKNVRENPRKAEAWTNFGAYLHEVENKQEEAEHAYIEALKADPTWSQAVGNLANIRWDQGDRDEAHRLYRECLNEQPDNHIHRRNLSRLVLETAGAEEARSIILEFPTARDVKVLADELDRLEALEQAGD